MNPLRKISGHGLSIGLHLLFVPLIVMAVVLFQERLYGDSGGNIITVINQESFNFVHNRYILWVSGLLPVIAIKFGASLKGVLIVASLGYVLYYYVVFIIALHVLKDKYAAIGILMIQFLLATYLYFACPMFELPFVTALLFLYHSIVTNTSLAGYKFYILSGLIFFFVITGYPTAILGLVFLFIYDREALHLHLKWLIPMTVAIWLFSTFTLDTYEASILSDAQENLSDMVSSTFAAFIKLIRKLPFLILSMPGIFLMGITLTIYYLFNRKFRSLIIFNGFIAFYVLAVVFIYRSKTIYEHNLSLLILVVTLPFIYELLSSSRRSTRVIGSTIIALTLIIELNQIIQLSKEHTQRVEFIQNTALHGRSNGEHLLLIDNNNLVQGRKLSNSRYVIESLLISSLSAEDQSSVIFAKSDWDNVDDSDSSTDGQLRDRINDKFNRMKEEANPKYFNLQDAPITYLNAEGTNDTEYISEYVHLEIDATTVIFRKNRRQNVSITIRNTGDEKVYSNLDQHLFMSYSWIKDGQMLPKDSLLIPLEVDIYDTYEQVITIRTPRQKGQYDLAIDLLIDEAVDKGNLIMRDPKWLNNGHRIKVEIK